MRSSSAHPAKIVIILFKLLAGIHGLFGVTIVYFLPIAYYSGEFADLSSGQVALKSLGTLIGGTFLGLCAWSAWRKPQLTSLFAWASLVTYIVTGAADQVAINGISGMMNLMPAYYYAIGVRALAAITLGVLARRYQVESSW